MICMPSISSLLYLQSTDLWWFRTTKSLKTYWPEQHNQFMYWETKPTIAITLESQIFQSRKPKQCTITSWKKSFQNTDFFRNRLLVSIFFNTHFHPFSLTGHQCQTGHPFLDIKAYSFSYLHYLLKVQRGKTSSVCFNLYSNGELHYKTSLWARFNPSLSVFKRICVKTVRLHSPSFFSSSPITQTNLKYC